MARRMKVPEAALDNFEVLNGLEAGTPLRAGDRYKLVVD